MATGLGTCPGRGGAGECVNTRGVQGPFQDWEPWVFSLYQGTRSRHISPLSWGVKAAATSSLPRGFYGGHTIPPFPLLGAFLPRNPGTLNSGSQTQMHRAVAAGGINDKKANRH